MGNLLPYGTMFILALAFIFGYHQQKQVGLSSGKSFLSYLIAFVIQCAIYPTMLLISAFTATLTDSNLVLSDETIKILNNIGWFWGFLLLAVIPAVVEELICRGIIYGMARRHSIWLAFLFSIICFSMMHQNIDQLFYTILFGLATCFVREFTGSVFPCMLMHCTLNSVSVASIYFPDMSFTAEEFITSLFVLGIIAVFGILVAVGAIILLRKVCKYKNPDKQMNFDLNIPFVPYFIGWFICGMALAF